MATSVEDIVNQGLRRIGNEMPIGFIYEGSRAARVALEIYGQTRDDVFSLLNPPFARRNVALTLLKTAPPGGYGITPWTSAFPPPPWIYEYAYPSDCINLRAIRETPMLVPSFLPTAKLFTLANDTTLQQKVVLTNVPAAIGVYIGQVTDMTTWEATFTEAVIAALARRFAQALGADPNLLKYETGEEQATGAASIRDPS